MSAALTALFVVTGGWAAVRLARLLLPGGERGPVVDVVAELVHLAMSVVMIAMTWGVVTGPGDAGAVTTEAVFGVVAVWALVRLARPGSWARSAVIAHHLLMAVAMIWMLTAVPLLPRGTGTDDMPGMPGMGGPPAAPAPAWSIATTWLLVLLLTAAAVLWTVRAARVAAGTPDAHPGAATAGCGGVAVLASSVAAPARVTTPLVGRLDACCHALMSVGTAVMIVAMVP